MLRIPMEITRIQKLAVACKYEKYSQEKYYYDLPMCFVMLVQMIISIESFTTNLTREPIVSNVDRSVTISVSKCGKCFGAIVAFISCTRVFLHARFVVAAVI